MKSFHQTALAQLNALGLGAEQFDDETLTEFADRIRDEIDNQIALLENCKRFIARLIINDETTVEGRRKARRTDTRYNFFTE